MLGKKAYEHLDGKVKVELVRITHFSGGRVPVPVSDFVVRVHTDPPFDETVTCEKVEFAKDDAEQNVAFRCDGAAEWTVVRLRGGSRHIRECNPPVGTDRKPRFAAMARVVDIAPQLLECAVSDRLGQKRERLVEIVHSVREEAGSDSATALVLRQAAR